MGGKALSIGDRVEHRFVVDAAAMAAFQALSNDHSRMHTEDGYARSRGAEGVIVYGGIMLAHLSHVLGSAIPGDHGVSTNWEITYHSPLYVGEPGSADPRNCPGVKSGWGRPEQVRNSLRPALDRQWQDRERRSERGDR